MCRNITTLRGLEPEATDDEIEAAARQYVRKVSGVQKTSERTEAAFEKAVRKVTRATEELRRAAPSPAATAHPSAAAPDRRPRLADRSRRTVPRLALLPRANANRVYGESAFALAAAELAALGRGPLGEALGPAARETIGGVDYLVAVSDGPLPDDHRRILSNLSGLHALFELVDDGMLLPLVVDARTVLDDDLLTIQRYSGKTNEAFTHLLVNLALAQVPDGHARLVDGERLTLLDPMCGRGTTLNRAAVYGMDAIGVEADRRHVDAFTSFFATWLQDKRLRHKVERATLRKGRPVPVSVWRATYGEGRDVAEHRSIEVVQADTATTPEHVRARSVDVVVCDLPYGVHHGARHEASLARTPEALLEAALPGWAGALRPGGGMALAWNRRTLHRRRLAELVTEAGLEVAAPGDDAFVHRVDRSITRDVMIAERP